ncbi:MAG: dihydroorotase [Bacteroidia bacterium]|nr:dihydroorotase [Bacteroidia bacterium]
MSRLLIKDALLINEGTRTETDILVENGRISRISPNIHAIADRKIYAGGKYLLPGVIDDQVHFREPGLTHKADLSSESLAAVAGGITSFMEMPNTVPQTLTQELLEKKFRRAAEVSPANFSFFMGASNDNLEEVLKTNPLTVCGIKVFMGSSTGNMLVDDEKVLENIFREAPMLVATHCEKEEIIRQNTAFFLDQYGEDIPVKFHPEIRSEEACYVSSAQAVALAQKYGTRLHVLHISTEKELALFDNALPLHQKKITAEVCVHHLWFSAEDYTEKGLLIKWNPAVKKLSDREALRRALIEDRLDIIATDHAPHTREEKNNSYMKAPSGAPLVQHSLPAMLELAAEGVLSLEKVVEKMAHSPAVCFSIQERGFVREGYYADLVIVDPDQPWRVSKENILYKCGWSPLEGTLFRHKIDTTIVNGNVVWEGGRRVGDSKGMRLTFDR